MSWSLVSAALDGVELEVPVGARVSEDRVRLVLVYLAWRADKDTAEAWPAVARIAADTAMPESAVKRALRSLEAEGLITAKNGKRSGGRTPTRYVVTIPVMGDRVNPVMGDRVSSSDESPNPVMGDPNPVMGDRPPRSWVTAEPQLTTERSEGGGCGGEQPPPPDGGDVAQFAKLASAKLTGHTIQAGPKLAAEVDRLMLEGWTVAELVEFVATDWPAKIKASATGFTITKLAGIEGEPPMVYEDPVAAPLSDDEWHRARDAAAFELHPFLTIVCRCPHGAEEYLEGVTNGCDGRHFEALYEIPGTSEDGWASVDADGNVELDFATLEDLALIKAAVVEQARLCRQESER